MKEKPEFRWITTEDTNQPLTISGLAKTDNDKILYLITANKDLVQMSLYGKNWNFLVFNEEDSEKWIGKTVYIKEEEIKGKKIRTITKVV